jgi:hypothetical protein
MGMKKISFSWKKKNSYRERISSYDTDNGPVVKRIAE